MVEEKSKPYKAISRRAFCASALTAPIYIGAAMGLTRSSVLASQVNRKIKFYKNLGPGHIGVKANQRQALEYAVKYGFDSITPSLSEFENSSAAQIREWVEMMREKGIRYGTGGLPVQFRRDEMDSTRP